MREWIIYAPAKVNLFLNVLDKRPDGYHNIETVFEKIDLQDEIIIREKGISLDVKVEGRSLCPSGKDNIVYRAVQLLFQEADFKVGLEIILKKRIPVSAGLGGGSSDAGCLLRFINDIFKLGISSDHLFSIGREIGKDVPFFIQDSIFAVGRGAGEILEAIETDSFFWHIVLKPDVAISTAQMYKDIDKFSVNAPPRQFGIEKISAGIKNRDLVLLEKNYYNVFDQILTKCPDKSGDIKRAKGLLSNAGAGNCFLSGSGASIFCVVNEKNEAMDIFNRLSRVEGVDAFLATTYKGGCSYGDNRG